MRVYVPTTWALLRELRRHGLPAGTEGFAVTDALAVALGPDADADDGEEVALTAAADASLQLLADGPSQTGPRRAVLALDAAVLPEGPGEDADTHPGAVVLAEAVAWSVVDSVLADDPADAEQVARAVRLLRAAPEDPGPAHDEVDALTLGWFAPHEVG